MSGESGSQDLLLIIFLVNLGLQPLSAARFGRAHLGLPMMARVRSRMPSIVSSPDAAMLDRPAAGRLLVSSRQACSVVMSRVATTRVPGASRYAQPAGGG